MPDDDWTADDYVRELAEVGAEIAALFLRRRRLLVALRALRRQARRAPPAAPAPFRLIGADRAVSLSACPH